MAEATEPDNSVGIEDLDLYALFLRLLEKPGPERPPLVTDPSLPTMLEQVAAYLEVRDFPEVELPGSLQEAESNYLSLFEVGLPAPPCPLNESPYNRSEPPTRIIHENLLFYRAFGLDLKPENRELPDHISNQLEFLSYLTRLEEQSPDLETRESVRAGRRDFIERRALPWMPQVVQKLTDLGDRLYGPIFSLLEAYLRADLVSLV